MGIGRGDVEGVCGSLSCSDVLFFFAEMWSVTSSPGSSVVGVWEEFIIFFHLQVAKDEPILFGSDKEKNEPQGDMLVHTKRLETDQLPHPPPLYQPQPQTVHDLDQVLANRRGDEYKRFEHKMRQHGLVGMDCEEWNHLQHVKETHGRELFSYGTVPWDDAIDF